MFYVTNTTNASVITLYKASAHKVTVTRFDEFAKSVHWFTKRGCTPYFILNDIKCTVTAMFLTSKGTAFVTWKARTHSYATKTTSWNWFGIPEVSESEREAESYGSIEIKSVKGVTVSKVLHSDHSDNARYAATCGYTDIEFIDVNGNYRHWKFEDGGEIIEA